MLIFGLGHSDRPVMARDRTQIALHMLDGMSATLAEQAGGHVGGLAWSEDPLGLELSALRIDFEGLRRSRFRCRVGVRFG